MNKSGDDLVVVLSLDGNDFEVGIRGAGRLLSQFQNQAISSAQGVKRLDASVEGLAGRTRDLTVILATAEQALHTLFRATFGWQKAIMDAAGEIERLTVMMRGMSSEADVTKRELDALADTKFVTDFAQNAPFSMEAITDSFIKFRTVGIEPTDGSMKALTDAVATFGGGTDILHRATIAIQQMVGKGVISMEELRQQLGEAVPSAMAIMARSMSMSVAELVGKIESGTVESRSAINKMLSEMALTFDGAGVRMMTTWQGILQSMETRWKLFLKDVAGSAEDSDSFFSVVKDMADRMSQWLTSTEAKLFAEELAGAMKTLAEQMERVLVFTYQNRDAIASLLKLFATWFVVSRAAQMVHGLTMALTNLNSTTTMLGSSLTTYRHHMDSMRTALRNANEAFDQATTRAQQNQIAKSALIGTVGRLGMAFAALTGPIAMTASVLWTAYQAIKELAGGVDRATRTIIESRGLLASTENVEKVRENREQIVKDLEVAESALARFEERLANPAHLHDREGTEGLADGLREEVNKLRSDLEEADRALQLGIDGLHHLNVERSKAAVDRAIQHQIDPLRAVFREQREAHAIMLSEAQGDAARIAEINRLAVESAEELLAGQLGVINANLKAENDLLERYRNSAEELDQAALDEVARAEAAIDALKQRELDFREQHRSFVEAYEQANRFVEKPPRGQPKKPEYLKESERALQSMANMADSLAVRLARVRGRVEDTNPHLDSLNERVAQLLESVTPEHRTIFEQYAEQARELASELHSIERLHKAEKDGQQAYMQILNRTASALSDTERGRMMRLRAQTLELDEQIKVYEELLERMREAGVDPAQIQMFADALGQYHSEAMNEITRNAESSWQTMLREMNEFERDWAALWKSASDTAIDEMVRFAREGKFSFTNLIDHVLEQLLRVQLQKSLITPLTNVLDAVLPAFGGAAGASAGATSYGNSGFIGSVSTGAARTFANGGIMTEYGAMPLRRYANGGIAHSPQVAVFGEGAHREAYVPLPDGRTIPVTMKGGGAPTIHFNVINQTGQQVEAESAGGRFDGEQYVLDVVLKAVSRPGTFRDSMKGAVK